MEIYKRKENKDRDKLRINGELKNKFNKTGKNKKAVKTKAINPLKRRKSKEIQRNEMCGNI